MKHTDSEVPGTGDLALFALLKQKSLHPSSLQYVMKSGEQKSLHCTCQFIIIVFTITVFYCTHREELMIEIECLTYSSQRECSCSPMYMHMIYDVWI